MKKKEKYKANKKTKAATTFFGKIGESLSGLNNSKFFAGLVMILLNQSMNSLRWAQQVQIAVLLDLNL